MVKKMIITTLVSASALVLPFVSSAAATINIYQPSNSNLTEVDETGNETNAIKANQAQDLLLADDWLGDFSSDHDGLESITQTTPKHGVNVLTLYDSTHTLLVKQRVAKHKFSFTVGDILTDQPGQEIVLCTQDRNSQLPTIYNPNKVKIYSYDSTEQALILQSQFEPFVDDERYDYGCNNILIDDVDGDGETDIAVGKAKDPFGEFELHLYNAAGEAQNIITVANDAYMKPLSLGDIDGDKVKEILLSAYDSNGFYPRGVFLAVANLQGEILYSINADQTDYSVQAAFSDVTNDDKADVITYRGKKGNVYIHDSTGTIVQQFQVFPDEINKVKRSLIVNDLSSLYTN